MGSPDYGMDVCHTDFLPRNYFAAGVQIRPEHQPAVSLSEKYADVHSGRDISRAICIRSVLWYRAAMLLIGALIFKIKQDRFVLYL